MAEHSDIAWTDATINFWIGCTELSPACDNCYARIMAERYGWATWGHGQPRYKTKGAIATARKLQRKAEREGRRIKVFSNSLSDFGDAEVPDEWRDKVASIWDETPLLDWLILTKRPNVTRKFFARQPLRPNVAIGTTIENRAMLAARLPLLRQTPAARRFLSIEPLLEDLGELDLTGIDWVITGAESGHKARNCDIEWVRSLRDQCVSSGVAFFYKQAAIKGRVIHTPELDGRKWLEFPR